jgi:hypothetical protein
MNDTRLEISDKNHVTRIVMLMISSQFQNKDGNYSPILPGPSKKVAPYTYGDLFMVFLLVAFIIFFAYLMYQGPGPGGGEQNIQKEAGHRALAELVGEVRLLRLAVEKLAVR